MADLNFPTSPVDGQTYDNYTYVASKSVWQSIPGLPAGLLAGTIMGWGGATAPDQWLICDGSAVSRSTYSALYSAIGTTYGIGDGSTTFNLPDLRGKMPVGNHPGIAVTADSTTDVITSATPHGFVDGQKVYFTATAMPTNLTASTNYYVTASTSTTFKVASSLANTSTGVAAINFTTNGTAITAFASEFAGLNATGGTTNHSHRSGSMRAAVGATNGNINIIGYEAAVIQPDGLGPASISSYSVAGTVQGGTLGFNHYTPVYGNAEDKSSVSPYRVINYIIKYAAAYVPQESELVPRIDALESGRTNYIINGAFDIWQRGTTAVTANSSYAADRWMIGSGAGTNSVTQSTDVPTTLGMQYSISFAGTSTTNPTIRQRIEAQNALYLAGQTVTLSFYAKSTVGSAGIKINTGYPTTTADTFGAGFPTAATTTADQTALTLTPTGNASSSWTRYSVTFTVSANAVRGYQIDIYRESTTTSTTTLITGVQLEPGSYATSFKRNGPNIQAELAACMRYYITGTWAGPYYIGTGNATGYGSHNYSFAPMRVAPTATVLTFTNVDNAVNGGISVMGNSGVNGNFRNSSTGFPYYQFAATFKLEAEL